MDGGSRNNQAYNLSLLTTYDSIVGYHTLGSPVLVTDRARKDRSRTCWSMQHIRVSKSARSLRSTSLAQRRMMSVQCCVRQWNTVYQFAPQGVFHSGCGEVKWKGREYGATIEAINKSTITAIILLILRSFQRKGLCNSGL